MRFAARFGSGLLLLGSVLCAAEAQDSGRGLPAPPVTLERSVLTERALARDPAELPRAEPGAWANFFDPASQPEVGARLGRSVLAAVAAGQDFYTQGDYPAALAALYAVLEREPDLPAAWLLVGAAHYRLRRHGDGATAYERFLEVAPDQVHRTQAFGHCLVGLGRFEEAEAHYERVLAELPESFECWRGLGVARARAGEFDGALAALERALALRPDHLDARQWRGQVLLELGRAEEALAEALAAAEAAPFDPRPRFLAMEALFDLGRAEEAEALRPTWQRLDRLAQERRALELRILVEPRQSFWSRELLLLARDAGDAQGVEQALVHLARAHLGPYELGTLAIDAFLRMGDEGRARDAAERMGVEAGEDPRTWQRLALVWGLLGDLARQAEAAERLRALGGR